jgi:hypothetical protein
LTIPIRYTIIKTKTEYGGYIMREKFLLGATKDGELVFGSMEVRTWNGYPEFSATFDTVRPFREEDAPDPTDYWEGLLEECYTAEDKYNLCERFDCTPATLAERMAEENSGVMDMVDCSLYPETYDIDGTTWYFESSAGGQYDTRSDMGEYTDEAAYNELHALWDAYHLKQVDEDTRNQIAALRDRLAAIDEADWIINYIKINLMEAEQ